MISDAEQKNGRGPLRVSVVGLGYVGLVTAASLAEWGNDVVGIEVDEARLTALKNGRLPIFEPGLDELVRDNRAASRLRFAGPEAMAEAVGTSDVVMVAVGTHDGNGGWQTDTMSQTLGALVPLIQPHTTLVIRSTLPPGYVATLRSLMVSKARPDQRPTPTLLNPEFTKEGTAIRDFMEPDRVVLGIVTDEGGAGQRALTAIYEPSGAPVVVLPAIDASLGKLAANLFLATKISFANELAGICDSFGANVDNVVASMAHDPRIGGAFLHPGVGFGGSCLPNQVTMTLLAAQANEVNAPLLAAVKQINEFQPRRVLIALGELLPDLAAARIAVLGLTFKPDTDDVREAPARKVIHHLLAAGARVVAYDPMAKARDAARATFPELIVTDSPGAALAGADGVVLTTEWRELRELDWAAAAAVVHRPVIVDGRNALDPSAMTAAGWTYHGFGRGTSRPEGWTEPAPRADILQPVLVPGSLGRSLAE